MARDLFGTDGIRGLAGQYPLDEAGARQVGGAVGSLLRHGGQPILIGWDTRESSPTIVSALTAGITHVGTAVVAAGVMPTPALAYLTRANDFAAGIMVTASHNPYQYNGIKVFDSSGDKLSDATEATLNQLIASGSESMGPAQSSTNTTLLGSYEDFLVASADRRQLSGLKLAIDTANGAASGLAQRVFERLGARVTPLFNTPDGQNINAGCGATDTNALQKTVVDQQLSLGIAVDGDADRLIMVDELGRQVDGDHILYILAVHGRAPGVVASVMSNAGLEQALQAKGITLLRSDVGDHHVLERLHEMSYPFGGEQSGHIIVYDLLRTGDALLGAVQVLKAVQQSGKSLAQWRDEVTLLPQATVNIPLPDKSLLDRSAVKAYIAEQANSLKSQGRLLIRPSGTEPLARVMVEAADAQAAAERIAHQLQQLLTTQGSRHD